MNSDKVYNEYVTADTTFPAVIHSWEVSLADQGKSVYTIKSFSSDLHLMASYFPPNKTVGSVSTKDIENFLKWMREDRPVACSEKTYSRRITAIKSFFRWLEKYGIITEDPSVPIIQKGVRSPLPEILTIEEYSKVINAADSYLNDKKSDYRPATLTRLLLATGIKKSELLNIALNHISEDNTDEPQLFVRYPTLTSRYKEREIDLPLDWIPMYHGFCEQYKQKDMLFPWCARNLEYVLEDVGKRAELSKHLSFAMCRWTCAVHDLCINTDPASIRVKLGVSKIQWVEIKQKLEQLRTVYTA